MITEKRMKDRSQTLASSGKPVKRRAAGRMALALTAALAVLAMAGPSWAGGDNWSPRLGYHDEGRGFGGRGFDGRGFDGRGFEGHRYYDPRPRFYYSAPRYYYSPPPYYYYPSPHYYYYYQLPHSIY